MTIEINLNSFFKNFLDKDQKIHYDNNLKTCKNIGAKIKEEINSNQNEIFNSLTQAYQSKIFSLKNQLDKSKKKLIIGIGGSTAGLKSFTEYTDQNYLFIDNLNYSKINELLSKKDILDYSIYLISKSGNTFETLAALNLLYQHAKKINSLEKLFSKMTCITEDSDNNLYNFAKKNNVRLIIHNKKIGGRYSFFSETGILPSNLSETDVATTCKFDDFLGEDFNSAIVNSAIIMTITKTKMIKKNINLFYDEKLRFFGAVSYTHLTLPTKA